MILKCLSKTPLIGWTQRQNIDLQSPMYDCFWKDRTTACNGKMVWMGHLIDLFILLTCNKMLTCMVLGFL